MKKSNDVRLRPDLVGWSLREAYWAQLEHGLMGTFPALVNDPENTEAEGELFFCTDKEVLREILILLPRRPFRLSKNLVLLSPDKSYGFCVQALFEQWRMDRQSESVRVVTRDDMTTLSSPGLFRWASGLISTRPEKEPSENLFLQRLDSALDRV